MGEVWGCKVRGKGCVRCEGDVCVWESDGDENGEVNTQLG